ncbi:MAG TPA: S-methyl-5-thioribose-1-phosphate isomerase [Actinomycetales bacterium]|nr:S-methyl-5-thioribose-1-phosphate isomerase [Actinomycetales bacterium]
MVVAIEWRRNPQPHIRLIDQTVLPAREEYLEITTVADLVAAIQSLAVRGAPALGAAGALGVVVAMNQAQREGWDEAELQRNVDLIRDARPTAVNLAWGVSEVRDAMPEGVERVLELAQRLVDEDGAANRALSKLGADWILEATGKESVRVVTHCNTGALATTAWGTAYGIIHDLHERGQLGMVYADETRPLLQGSRLTSWELTKDGIEHVIQADGAASSTILRGLADVAIIGADRIVANGDTANKVGSVALALACQRAGIPFVVAAPFSTVDTETATGEDIHIEERDALEVLELGGVRTAPATATAFNPAFDVTPHDLISAIVTEKGVVEPARSGGEALFADLVSESK